MYYLKRIKRKLFNIKMRILIYLEYITKGKIKKFKKIDVNDINSLFPLEFNKYTHYSFKEHQLNYDFLTYLRKDSDKLVIFFNGAINTEKSQPIFQRWSWQNNLPYSSIVFSDPTILDMFQTKKIQANIGWYQGNNSNFALNRIIDIVNEFANELQVNTSNILFYGSSAGGFASLYASCLLTGSRVCVVNPQINIFNYHKQHSNKILEHLNIDLPANHEFKIRLDIVKLYQYDIVEIPKQIYYKQNILDTHHYNEHYLSFVDMMKEKKKEKNLYTVFTEDERGHESIPLYEEALVDIENTFNMPLERKDDVI